MPSTVATAAPRLRDFIMVGLQWSWLHDQSTVLQVPRQHVKAKKTMVMIPLTRRAAAILARQQRHDATPSVFTQPNGQPYSSDQVGMAFIRMAKEAGLLGVSLHTLQHTFFSRLVQEGRPLPEVAILAGHRNIKMTLRYAHVAPSHLRAGIDALGSGIPRHPVGPALCTEPRVTPVSREFSEIA